MVFSHSTTVAVYKPVEALLRPACILIRMLKPSHSPVLRQPFKRHLVPIYLITFLLTFHTLVVAYINSSFLEQYISAADVGTIYMVGSALSIVVFLSAARVLRIIGNFKFTLGLLFLDFIAVLGMAYTNDLHVAIPLFLIHLITVPLIIFNIDVFLEEHIGTNESGTGTRRGLLLAMSGIVGAIAPLTSTLFINDATSDFTGAYILSAATLVPIVILLMFFFSDFKDPEYNEIKFFSAVRSFWKKRNIRNVFSCHFILQIFFVMMVVYSPIYLTQHIGLTWLEFGIVMFFAQLAYVIFEYPVGYIADKYIGEKEMMGLGFLVLALSTSWIAFVTVPSVLIWSVIMFTTRIGASLVEVTTETYFFKQTRSADAQVISFFRIMRPFASVIGALLASFTLLYVPFNLLFIVTAALMIPALFLTLDIEDTK